MSDKIRVGISACLLGEKVRYDGGHKLDHYLKDTLGRFVEWMPVCPEVESGLPVPREAMHLTGMAGSPRLVTRKTGTDYTGLMQQWAGGRLEELEKEGLCGFVFKSRSPSSGMRGVKVYNPSGIAVNSGVGIFARAFMDMFPLIPVEDDGRLNDPDLRENFVERLFIFKRWKAMNAAGGTIGDLVSFHSDHKLLILAHSPRHYTMLGRLVAGARKKDRQRILTEYESMLMEGLKFIATKKKNTNVLQHAAGYFKKQLTAEEKKELLELIETYHRGLVPLIAPIVLINHYVSKFDEPYLKRQYYLNPHPAELMLRNHV